MRLPRISIVVSSVLWPKDDPVDENVGPLSILGLEMSQLFT
jgi:hypothetical protein